MTYAPQTWQDNNASYPASAARFTNIENGLQAADSVSVKIASYSPYGDGTTDDSPAITSALAALPSGGGIIEFDPTMSYYLDLSVATSGIAVTKM